MIRAFCDPAQIICDMIHIYFTLIERRQVERLTRVKLFRSKAIGHAILDNLLSKQRSKQALLQINQLKRQTKSALLFEKIKKKFRLKKVLNKTTSGRAGSLRGLACKTCIVTYNL